MFEVRSLTQRLRSPIALIELRPKSSSVSTRFPARAAAMATQAASVSKFPRKEAAVRVTLARSASAKAYLRWWTLDCARIQASRESG